MLGKNIVIVGGAGYVGRAILNQLSKKPTLSLVSIQRSSPTSDKTISGVDYVKADVFNTQQYREKIKDADVVIHSMGVLLDSSVTKNAKPGDEGTYEKVNYESAKVLADVANSFDDKKRKFIYLSANRSPPFLPRYLETKLKAEEYINGLSNLSFVALRPGVIVDSSERPITMPLGYLADIGNFINRTSLFQSLKGIKYVKDVAENFEVDKSIQREDVAKAVAFLAISDEMSGLRVLKHDEILAAARKYSDVLNNNYS